MIGSENFPGLACWSLENDNHERTHQEGGVGLLCIIQTRVVINFIRAILLVIN